MLLEPGGDDAPGQRRGESGGEVVGAAARPGADCTVLPHVWEHARALSREPQYPQRSAKTPAFAQRCLQALSVQSHRSRPISALCDVCVLLCAAEHSAAVEAALQRVETLVRSGGAALPSGDDWWDAWYGNFALSHELARCCSCGATNAANTAPVLTQLKQGRLLQLGASGPGKARGSAAARGKTSEQSSSWRSKGGKDKRNLLLARGGQLQLGQTSFKPLATSRKEKSSAALVARLMEEYRAANTHAKALQMRRLARSNPLLQLGLVPEGALECLIALRFVFPALAHATREPLLPEEVRDCPHGRAPPPHAVPAPVPLAESWGVWLGVCRGRTSEGIDLRDDDARTVLVVGVPLMGWKDRAVRVKWAYNDERRSLRLRSSTIESVDEEAEAPSTDSVVVGGEDWYLSNAMRSINQAAGRAVRHAKDHGALVLVDNRLMRKKEAESLSKWIFDSVER